MSLHPGDSTLIFQGRPIKYCSPDESIYFALLAWLVFVCFSNCANIYSHIHVYFYLFGLFVDKGYCLVTQAGQELSVLLHLPPRLWGLGVLCITPGLANI